MAVEVATLQFKADTTDLAKVEARLKRLSKAANSAEHNLDDVSKEVKGVGKSAKSATKLIAPMAVALASLGAVSKVVSVAREFDIINASLKTVTGSAESAQRAFGRIQDFAATTPFDLQQVANAFVKLQAFGLDPSDEALQSYGNTAAAMGKDLNQMIEAVADAATGEFERLKEFGIKARSEGDSVSLTFKGTTTTIGKNSEEIQQFLLGIGNVEFAGAMAERAATLDGAISNLGDSVDQLFLTIAQGDGGVMNDFTRGLTEMVTGLTEFLALSSGSAGLDLQLKDVEGDIENVLVNITAYERKLQTMEGVPILGDHYEAQLERLNNDLAELIARRNEVSEQIAEEDLAITEETEANKTAREKAAEEERNRVKAEARAEDLVDAKEYMAELMAMNDTKLQALERSEAEQMTMLQDFRTQGLITEQEYQDALTEIMANGHAERKDIRLKELEDLHAENDALMEGIIEQDEKRKEQADQTTQTLLAFEDVLMKGKSEKEKMAFRTAINLANAEKRENAKSIISNSYDAAMKAYKSLAGIPIIGPALGAAAAATILAAGVSFAAQSLSGRALGGQVRAGESYVVGERGPEVLTMGGMGNITPNSALGQGSGGVVNKTANVNFNITANDSQGFDELLVNRRGLIINIINDAIEDQGRAAII